MKVCYMEEKALDFLRWDVDANFEKYQSDIQWINQYFSEKGIDKYFFDIGLEVSDYQLVGDSSDEDFQNAKILYETFKGKLNPAQASDPRLWIYLAHTHDRKYMYGRWKNHPVRERYFFNPSDAKSYARQGIARLYWSANITYDVSNENPYEYTEILFTKQDIVSGIMERSYSRNKTIVLAILKELKKHPNILSDRDLTRKFLKRLNQEGAITALDFLDDKQATERCKKLMDEIH